MRISTCGYDDADLRARAERIWSQSLGRTYVYFMHEEAPGTRFAQRPNELWRAALGSECKFSKSRDG